MSDEKDIIYGSRSRPIDFKPLAPRFTIDEPSECKYARIILAYPGTRARTLISIFKKKGWNVVHLDDFGYRSPPGEFWNWNISTKVLESRISDVELKKEKTWFIGWGTNWEKFFLMADNNLGILECDDDLYKKICSEYRQTDEYRWDQKLISKSPTYKSEFTIYFHLESLKRFKENFYEVCDTCAIQPLKFYIKRRGALMEVDADV